MQRARARISAASGPSRCWARWADSAAGCGRSGATWLAVVLLVGAVGLVVVGYVAASQQRHRRHHRSGGARGARLRRPGGRRPGAGRERDHRHREPAAGREVAAAWLGGPHRGHGPPRGGALRRDGPRGAPVAAGGTVRTARRDSSARVVGPRPLLLRTELPRTPASQGGRPGAGVPARRTRGRAAVVHQRHVDVRTIEPHRGRPRAAAGVRRGRGQCRAVSPRAGCDGGAQRATRPGAGALPRGAGAGRAPGRRWRGACRAQGRRRRARAPGRQPAATRVGPPDGGAVPGRPHARARRSRHPGSGRRLHERGRARADRCRCAHDLDGP